MKNFEKNRTINIIYNFRSPIDKYPFYMLIETAGSRSEHDEEKLNNFLEKSMSNGHVLDGTVTTSPSQIKKIWQLRELIPTSLIQGTYCFKYDMSLPLSHFYEIVPETKKRVGDLAKVVCGYGHIGDSNLHLNVCSDEFTQELYQRIEPFVYEYTSKLKGSVSAEHGIGFLKPKYLKYSKSPEAISMMKELKELMDPNGILNPYKMLP